jgi:hypothetical protein
LIVRGRLEVIGRLGIAASYRLEDRLDRRADRFARRLDKPRWPGKDRESLETGHLFGQLTVDAQRLDTVREKVSVARPCRWYER